MVYDIPVFKDLAHWIANGSVLQLFEKSFGE